ncbi:hypothetical protein NL676_033923 [Syzygium grande]|nr:hypothetical protein NL676_033923 [Syzygium grande]
MGGPSLKAPRPIRRPYVAGSALARSPPSSVTFNLSRAITGAPRSHRPIAGRSKNSKPLEGDEQRTLASFDTESQHQSQLSLSISLSKPRTSPSSAVRTIRRPPATAGGDLNPPGPPPATRPVGGEAVTSPRRPRNAVMLRRRYDRERAIGDFLCRPSRRPRASDLGDDEVPMLMTSFAAGDRDACVAFCLFCRRLSFVLRSPR